MGRDLHNLWGPPCSNSTKIKGTLANSLNRGRASARLLATGRLTAPPPPPSPTPHHCSGTGTANNISQSKYGQNINTKGLPRVGFISIFVPFVTIQ
ncbi:hypothetical protein PoB_002342500 [Plakobranchus ocellatus]|uniref:Uncharacterized protein n=1 Tax=Plakobranchus ocellatus TaxID=259542 RepID=A0AAV3ZML3_9GAST|nr:hypothetical protein PoB_002342500 [Plakobranchus ocellatus]